MIRIAAGSIRDLTDETLAFAKQLGCSGVILNTPPLSGHPSYGSNVIGGEYWRRPGADTAPVKWDFLELLHLRQRIEAAGLRLEAIENVPIHFYEDAILGGPMRDEQIANYCETIRNLGRAGIAILGYHWMANRVWRTSKHGPARGGATTSTFDMSLAAPAPPTFGRVYTADEIWDNYARFIQAVLPVAEEAGVTLALHPDDPPVEMLGGVARIMHGIDAYRRAIGEIAPSPNHKLNFCMGTWAEQGIEPMFEAMRHFGAAGKIAYVHFRNVRGTVPRFEETFLDEGDVDCARAIRLLDEIGFDGCLIDDHVPHMTNDTVYMHRGRAYAIGYIRGLVHAIQGRR
jgi:mannonate dehydratase